MHLATESGRVSTNEIVPSPGALGFVFGHIPALDGLRGTAILLVMISHFIWVPLVLDRLGWAGRTLGHVSECGWIGVELFFVLSGFLITGILVDSKGAENYLSSFFIRRALRILPLSYSALFLLLILCPLLGKMGLPFMPKRIHSVQLWYWFYAGNWGLYFGRSNDFFLHFWSLAVEEQFYLLWPWVVFAASRRMLARICIAVALLAPIVRILLYAKGLQVSDIFVFTSSHFDSLCLGALAALLIRDENWARRLLPKLDYFLYSGLALFCLVWAANGSLSVDDAPTFIFGGFPLAIFFTGILLRAIAMTRPESWFKQCLQASWLRSCGKYSYAMYVLHFPLVVVYNCNLLPYLLRIIWHTSFHLWFDGAGMLGQAAVGFMLILNVLAACLFCFALGKLSWWGFEGPINGLKRHFRPRWRNNITKPAES